MKHTILKALFGSLAPPERLPQLKPFFASIGVMMLHKKKSIPFRMFEYGQIGYIFPNHHSFYNKKFVERRKCIHA